MTDQSIAPNERDIYYARAVAWSNDREASSRLSRRVAWLVAGVAVGIAMLEAVALALLMPLKTVVPYTLLVDRHTGFVQPLRGNGADPLTADWALVQSLLAQYVIAREGFDIAGISTDYRKVALWSGDAAQSSYLALMPVNNPNSPLQRLPRSTVLSVRIKSVSPLSTGSALVRFDTERRDRGQASGSTESFVSIVRYRFSGAPMALEDRLLNPLGFQVVHYRRDQEAPPAVPRIGSSGRALPVSPPAGSVR